MHRILKTFVFCLVTFLAVGQQRGLNYQAVIINPKPVELPGFSAVGQPLSNGKVWLKFTIKRVGVIEYEEIQATSTDEFGLVDLTIGAGLVNKSVSKNASFDEIEWDDKIKTLSVSINFDGLEKYTAILQDQKFSFSPYALYAASVDYKNVRSAPTSLSAFTNDPGFLVNKDLDPLRKDILANTTTIEANQLATNIRLTIIEKGFVSINEKIKQDSIQVSSSISAINARNKVDSLNIVTLNSGLSEVKNTISAQSVQLNQTKNQVNFIQSLSESTVNTLNNLGNTYESIGNKSNNIPNDTGSSSKYPTVGAVQAYVADAISGIPTNVNLNNKENIFNKSNDMVADATSTIKYPSVKTVKDYVDAAVVASTTMSTATQNALNLKENVANKSTDMVADAASLSKYPAVKTVKDYIDAAVGANNTISTATQNALNLKENLANKSTDLVADAASTTKYPSVKTIKDYVDAQVSSGTADATATSMGKLQLGGDLAGSGTTAAAPIISDNAITSSKLAAGSVTDSKIAAGISASKVGLGNVDNTSDANKPVSTATQTALNLKENIGNKSTDLVADAASTTKYPSVKTIKDYVDAQVSSGTADATTTSMGKLQLGGDLAGSGTTAAAPVISDNAITTVKINAAAVTTSKIADANITYAKIQNVSATDKVLGRVSTGAGVIEEISTTGSGNVVRATSPTLVTPVIGAATGTSLSVSGQLTSTVATGTAPLVVTSTTPVANLSIGGNASTATTATNLAGGAAGSIPYQTAAGTTALLATGSANQFLTSNGSGGYTWTNASGSTGVPYTGATQAVNLGAFDLTVNGIKIGRGNNSVETNTGVGYGTLGSVTTPSPSEGKDLTAVGYNALPLNTSGYSNTAVGHNSLFANTSGFNNTAIGKAALSSNLSGRDNFAGGIDALKQNSSGWYNTAIGGGALTSNTSGGYNTAIGYWSLRHLAGTSSNTSNNVALGSDAGRFFGAGTSNTLSISSKGVFLGSNTRPSANSSINEVVIGADAIGNGNNTVTIGNSSTTDNFFTGNINGATWNGTAISIAKGGTGQTTKAAAFDALSPMTTEGDLIYGGTSGTGTRLAKGTDGQVLTLASGIPSWSSPSGVSSVGLISGSSTANGASITSGVLNLAPADASNGGVVTTGAQTFAGTKTFSSTISGSISGNAATVTNGVYTTSKLSALSATTSSELAGVISDETGSGALVFANSPTLTTPTLGAASATTVAFSGSTSGSATLAAPAVAGTNTAITLPAASGTLATLEGTETLTNKTLTSPILTAPVLGTPASGTLMNATGLPLTTGVTGTLPIANGGTGATTAIAAFNALSPMTTSGDIIFRNSSNTAARLGIGTTGQVLTVSSGLPAWTTFSGGVTTMAAIGSSANANGATISGSTLTLQAADSNFGGLVTTLAQTFAGAKIFNSNITTNGVVVGRLGTPDNLVVGFSALNSNGSSFNTAIGDYTLNKVTSSGGSNVAVGYASLYNNTSGTNSVAVGRNALSSATTGSDNTALGNQSGNQITTGSGNVFLGSDAGRYIGATGTTGNTTGSNSIYIGYLTSPLSNGDANEIVIAGGGVPKTVGLGSHTTLIGNSATTLTQLMGALNVPITTASTSTTTGALRVGGGAGIAGNANIGGIITVAGGTAASGAGSNSLIEAQDGASGNNGGALNLIAGNGGAGTTTGGNINLTTGTASGGTGGDVVMNMGTGSSAANTGSLLINTTSNPMSSNSKAMFNMVVPTGQDGLNIKSNANGNNMLNLWQTGSTGSNLIAFYKGDTQTSVGTISVTTTATTYNTTSDYRLKSDFRSFNASALLQQIKVYDYQWKQDKSRSFGVKAHELQEVIPYAVTGEKDGVNADGSIKAQSVDYSKIVPVLVKAVQEQEAIIRDAKKENELLKNQIDLQNKRLERLEKLLEK